MQTIASQNQQVTTAATVFQQGTAPAMPATTVYAAPAAVVESARLRVCSFNDRGYGELAQGGAG